MYIYRIRYTLCKQMATETTMRQTSMRFGRDLWALLEDEAALVGVSISQYIREAALARATAAAVARGQEPFAVLAGAGHPAPEEAADAGSPTSVAASAATARSDAQALRGESKQARSMARLERSRGEARRNSRQRPEGST